MDGFFHGLLVPDAVRAQAQKRPDAVALICGEKRLAFRELEHRSDALAHRLLARGAVAGSCVAILAERSPETVVGLLAILKAGCAYVPIDPEYPADLLAFTFADCGARFALTTRPLSGKVPASEVEVLLLEDQQDTDSPAGLLPSALADRLAYVIYTSGSTGKPKGVLVSHGNLAHSTRARLEFYTVPPTRFLLLSSFAFDSSVAGIFWTLCSGGTLVLPAGGEERDPAALAALIDAERITHTLCLPSLHALLLSAPGRLDSLATVIVAGENCPPALPAEHARRLPRAALFNEYGPTEATVWSTACQLDATQPLTIGKPIARTQIHLLDEAGNPVATGLPGEMHIGGDGVAQGYLNQPELTAATFLPDPWSTVPGARIYKTGDLAREFPDGNLEFLGRIDRQVKIRGHRIELDAIEAALLTAPGIRATAAVVQQTNDGGGRLVAYFTPRECPVIELRRVLAEKLPAFMMPSGFIGLDTFPLTPNGKLDRAALPAPTRERPSLDSAFATPRGPLEQHLAAEWRDALELDEVGIDDKFFELGGDSLRAAMLVARLQQKIGEPVFVVAIFEAPTVAQLASYLRKHYPAAIARTFSEAAASGNAHPPKLSASTIERVRASIPKYRPTLSSPVAKNRRAIFILSPPRSGTTLLRAMLAGHPALFTTSELRLLGCDTLAERRAACSGAGSIWRDGPIRAIQQIRGCDAAEAERLFAECERANLTTTEFFARLQRWIAPRELVDKSPSYALDPATLRQAESIFDDAFYIHLSRHPYEMIRSFEKQRMDRVYLPQALDLTPREAGENVWLIAHQNTLDFLATVPGERQHHLRFTDLVGDPRSSMEALCAALAIPFDPALLDPYKSETRAETSALHTADDPRFREHRAINSKVAEGWFGVLTDNFLSDQTWQLAARLGYEKPAALSPPNRAVPVADEPIAIIGMAGRFPGARDVAAFWENLCAGVESIRPFTPEELRASGIDPAILEQPGYVNAGAPIDDADRFAASFFGYPPREAELMDPQQRVFLECAWEAFEHAGQDVSRCSGAIGVYAGLALNSYFQNNLATRPELAPLLGQYALTLGNEKDFVATRVAHKLDLRGPAIGVQTACSSSLVALHLACQSLRTGEIEMALVGGGRIRTPLHAGYEHVDGGIPSPDGHCRAFDAEARGCVAASGIAAVVLKRLSDAQRDGDHIFGVIKATAINNDGAAKAGFTAPAVAGQAEVISRAHAAAGVTADTISYVEAHGTGTALGDPIEIAALTRAFRKTSAATAHCRIGSVKTNIGHLDAGAGVAGLIKTALALDRGVLPPSLHFKTANPQIDFAGSPFVVNSALSEWPRGDKPRRAGVSSFGIGGTNAHAVLEEAPACESSAGGRPWQLLVLSAKTPAALDHAALHLARHLREHPDLSLADVAHTLQVGRHEFQNRRIVVARDLADAVGALEKNDARRVFTGTAAASGATVAFMFPGQGAQHPGMCRELFDSEPVFRDALRQCAAILEPHFDLLDALYSAGTSAAALTETAIAQPAIFAVEYAMAQLWQSWGVRPSALVGHSVGEFAAACLAGVFPLDDALTLLATRARLMQEIPSGAMLAVRLSEAELTPHLNHEIELAAVNSPRLCVVSGTRERLAVFAGEMEARGVPSAALQTSHAFHSAMMEPVLAPFTAVARKARMNAPNIPMLSTLTGNGADFTRPEYWARQLRETVRFSAAIAKVEPQHLLLEIGPGTTLASLARQSRGGTVISSLSSSGTQDQAAMLEALGRLWLGGVAIDWSLHRAGERRLRVPLPTYPFERERYWIEPARGHSTSPPDQLPTAIPVGADAAPARESAAPALTALRSLLHEMSGVPIEKLAASATLLELGFDSLFLTQVALALQKSFGVKVAFRQLFEELSTLEALAAHLEKTGAKDPANQPRSLSSKASAPPEFTSFGPFRPIAGEAGERLTARQQEHLNSLSGRYSSRTAQSKRMTQEQRAHFADPRTISGFRPIWKELVYPIVVERSAGSKMWDIDGNEYVDFTMGFGTNLLGHSPPFITDALADQLTRGIEIGPQSPIAGEVARLLCEFSGMDRAAFCNTGSEATVAAVRLARTVTGRDRIATCSGYHGINDEFLVRAKTIDGKRRSVAIAPGIPDHVAREVLAVEYGSPESLEILRAHAHELAAILVEPVQSRHPDLQPRAFLHELRRIAQDSGAVLIFDEVITGLRCHPGGAQAWFGVRADLVAYGKIIGGGMPIGALCGRAKYMDALDGGAWNFGDDSRPETGVTFFAGTYVRHPLALAASRAMLRHLQSEGAALQERLNERTAALVDGLKTLIGTGSPVRIESFSSMFIVKFDDDFKHGGLLFFHLREKGIHAWDNRLLFLSTAHTEEDLANLVRAFGESLAEMKVGGFLPAKDAPSEIVSAPGEVVVPAAQSSAVQPPTVMPAPETAARTLQFSLYFFGNYPAAHRPDKYELIIESTKFADRHGFTAVWLPERHFHSIGGFSPNAAVMAAALARETTQIQLRAGSVVLPLHHPVRVAEEWSLVDNLSNGRVGISIASGWHPNDFVFAPDAYASRRELCSSALETIRTLWRGDSITARGGTGTDIDVKLFPLPVQRELPVWLTCVQRESYEKAGTLGLNILAQLQNQTLDEVAAKIAIYREARTRAGHGRGHVTMLLHTFLAPDAAHARALTRAPLRDYLRAHVEISQKKIGGGAEVGGGELEFLLDRAAEEYARGKAFIGTPESCAEIAEHLRAIGVDEVGCLVDFGVEPEAVLASLPLLDDLRQRFVRELPAALDIEHPTSNTEHRAAETRTTHTLPLTDAQRGLCLLAAVGEDGSRAHNETSALELRGPLDVAALRGGLQACVGRHEALRTTVDPAAETQAIHPTAELGIPLIDCGSPEELARALGEVRAFRFDFSRAPIMDARLLRLAPEHHVLLLTFHHILGNGPSYVAVFEDLCASYLGEALGPAMQLSEFLTVRKAPGPVAESFWKAQFATEIPALELPLDHPRPAIKTNRGARATMRLESDFVASLRATGAAHGGSLFMLLLSAFQTLLHRLSGQDDVVVGVPFDDMIRTLPGGNGLFANTTNMAPLRSRISGATTFAAMLATNRQLVLEAHEHQRFFFGRLITALNLPFDASRTPLFSAAFNFESGSYRQQLGGLTVELVTDREPFLSLRDTAIFELFLNVAEQDGALFFRCDFNTGLFELATIQRWLGHLRTLLESIVADPQRPLAELSLLTESERRQLLVEWNDTTRDFPRDQSIPSLFEKWARRTPHAVALIDGPERLTYSELDARAERVARHLRAGGIQPGELVGLPAERSASFVESVLGILKAGGAYVPLDPEEPAERLDRMRRECPRILDPRAVGTAGTVEPLRLEIPADGPAYVLYTSGSTGTPKGVIVPHRAVARLVINSDYVHLQSDDVVAFASNVCFDAATFEIWGALLNGGALVITPREILLSPTSFSEHLATHRITTLFLTTALFNQLARFDPGMFRNLRNLIFGGEIADAKCVELVRTQGQPQRFVHAYGPTETTTFAICHPVAQIAGGRVPIGRPIANTTAYLLDEKMAPVPIGVTGQIYLGGPGLALGYLNDPALTAERFLQTAFGRVYRTGDLARWLADGTIDFVRRGDQQIKLRGFRIEPGEIENALKRHPGIGQVVVTLRDGNDGDQMLVAYFMAAREPAPAAAELREFLRRLVPAHAIPATFISVPNFPLTSNGKLDLRALPAPGFSPAAHETVIRPRDETERAVAALWAEILGRDGASIRDDFFLIGGHSLLALRLISRLREQFGIDVPVRELFAAPTIEGLARFLSEARGTMPAAAFRHLIPVQPGDSRRTALYLVPGGWGGEEEFVSYRKLAHEIDPALPVFGLRARASGSESMRHDSVDEMAAAYVSEIVEKQPLGPYLLAGECVGAVIAYEIARRLQMQGAHVGLLALLDAEHPGADTLRDFEEATRRARWSNFWRDRIAGPARDHWQRISRLPWRGKLDYARLRLRRGPSQPLLGVSANERRKLMEYPEKMMTHRLGLFVGKVTLVLSEEVHRRHGQLGWESNELHPSLEVKIVPGDHDSYIRGHAASAAKALRHLIAEAVGDAP